MELSHIEIRDTNHKVEKNMIVMHGLLGNKLNWRGLCSREEVRKWCLRWLDLFKKKLLFGGIKKSHVIEPSWWNEL